MNSGGPTLGLFCSVRCPGSVILALYDTMRALRDADITVAGGFHSPLEHDCLRILLRGTVNIVFCPVSPLPVPNPWRKAAMERGRMEFRPAFETQQGRMTARLAHARNEFVASLSDVLFVAYASPGGKLERLAADVIAAGKPVLTLADRNNTALVALGARPLRPTELPASLSPEAR